jgi:cold shock CspA family protein
MSQTALARGEIDYVNPRSGCGFITSEVVEKDVLFLRDVVEGFVPEVGHKVRFEIVRTKNGPRAMDVRRL